MLHLPPAKCRCMSDVVLGRHMQWLQVLHTFQQGAETDRSSRLLYVAGRWPAEEAAFWKVKAALGCQLAEALGSSFGVSASASEACVDVLADGFAFRLFLWSTRCLLSQAD